MKKTIEIEIGNGQSGNHSAYFNEVFGEASLEVSDKLSCQKIRERVEQEIANLINEKLIELEGVLSEFSVYGLRVVLPQEKAFTKGYSGQFTIKKGDGFTLAAASIWLDYVTESFEGRNHQYPTGEYRIKINFNFRGCTYSLDDIDSLVGFLLEKFKEPVTDYMKVYLEKNHNC